MGPEQQRVVIEQAIEWHQRHVEGEMDPESRREYDSWMKIPEHAEEMARILEIDALIRITPFESDEKGADDGNDANNANDANKRPLALPDNIIPFPLKAPVPNPPVIREPEVQPRVARPAAVGLAKKITMAAFAAITVMIAAVTSVQSNGPSIVTQAGHWDKQVMEDGTVVHAAPNTRLRFDFSSKARAVTLVQGEAYFEVARDPDRPFIVATGVGTVRALGTAFATAYSGDEVVVTVASGKVGVDSLVDGMQPTLVANQQVVLSSTGVSEPVTVDADRELKWIRNWYVYHGERLGEIVEQLNRRNAVKVVVSDPRVWRMHFMVPDFKPSEPERFVAMINDWLAGSHNDFGNRNGGGAPLHLQPP